MKVPRGISKFIRDRYVWYIAILLGIIVIFTYIVEQVLFGKTLMESEWHPVYMTIRNFMFLGVVFLGAWRFGFKGGLAIGLAIGLIELPHVVTGMFVGDRRINNLIEFAVFAPVGVIVAWLVGVRKRVEKKLADSEVRYRRLFATAQDAILILDGDTGQIIDANPFIKDLLGYSLGELAGKNLWEICELKDTLASKISYQELHESGYKRWDSLPLVTKDGRIILVAIVANAYLVDHTRVIQCNIRDMTERENARRMLVESEEKFRSVTEYSPNMVFINKAGRIVYANRQCEDVMGYKREEFYAPGFDFMTLIAPQDRELVMANFRRHMASEEIPPYDYSLITRDGRRLEVILSTKLIDYEGGKAIVGIITDLTERKRAEEALREVEKKYRDLYENAPAIYYSVGADGRILMANKQTSNVLGYSKEELIGKPVFDLYAATPNGKEKAAALFRRFVSGEALQDEDLEMQTKDGQQLWILLSVEPIKDGSGRVIASRSVARDITEHKQAEKQLRFAAEEWRTTFDSITEMVSIMNRDSTIVRANKAFADAFKMPLKEIVGKHCYEIVHSSGKRPSWCVFAKMLETGKHEVTETFEPRLGTYLEISASPMQNDKGEVVGCVHVIGDITERKKMQEQLMTQDRLASIGQLVSGVAHELNNPLTSVIGFSELLLQRELPDDVKADLKIVNDEAKRTSLIVKNLLTFARQQPQEKRAIDINEPIQTVLQLRSHEQSISNIKVNTHYAQDLPQIMGNTSQFQQVFFNLIVNSEQAMLEAHNRGTLTITTERVGDIVKARFTDDGPGISPENMRRLFTTKEVGKGTGLGLSICHGIIIEHGGRIYAESEFGKGATFIVELPVIPKQATAEESAG